MAFDWAKLEIDRTVNYRGTKYRVIDESKSGLLIVAKEEEVINEEYPLKLFAIPNQ